MSLQGSEACPVAVGPCGGRGSASMPSTHVVLKLYSTSSPWLHSNLTGTAFSSLI